jgi:SAM-dependent methyltransferase
MPISETARSVARTLLGRRAARGVRRWLNRASLDPHWYVTRFAGRHGLEIGGPSEVFGDVGPISLYEVLSSLDNCLFASQTIWEGQVREGQHFQYSALKPPGCQFIADATNLNTIQDATYDCILGSHVLEHIANPLRALAEWTRILNDDGLLLIVLPHKDGTFDWRRPTTTLAHMIDDRDRNTNEDDLTHLEEILALHDLDRDKPAGSLEQFRSRCMANFHNRAMHHHVFDTLAAVRLVDCAGLQLLRVDLLRPFHIFLTCEKLRRTGDNGDFLSEHAMYRQRSPFPSDRRNAQKSV